jgi:hypothetical protein
MKTGKGGQQMILPAPVAYGFIPVGAALLIAGIWPVKAEGNWWRSSAWGVPDRIQLIVFGIALIAIGLDAAMYGILPIWGK